SPSTFVPDSNVSGQQAAQAAGVKPVANDVPPLKVPPLPQNDPAGPSGEELSVTPELNPEVGYNANRGAPGTSMAAATKDQKAYADKLAAVTGAVGGKFDPSKGVEDAWDATRLSWMDQMNDRAKYLQDKGYDAKIINIPGQGPMTVFKTKDSDTWRPINGANWSAGDVGRAAAQIPGLATQIGTAAATEGASLPARMLMQALTGTGEKGIEEVGNLAAGSNSGTIGENATN